MGDRVLRILLDCNTISDMMRRYVNSGPGLLTECVLLGEGSTFRSVLGLLVQFSAPLEQADKIASPTDSFARINIARLPLRLVAGLR